MLGNPDAPWPSHGSISNLRLSVCVKIVPIVPGGPPGAVDESASSAKTRQGCSSASQERRPTLAPSPSSPKFLTQNAGSSPSSEVSPARQGASPSGSSSSRGRRRQASQAASQCAARSEDDKARTISPPGGVFEKEEAISVVEDVVMPWSEEPPQPPSSLDKRVVGGSSSHSSGARRAARGPPSGRGNQKPAEVEHRNTESCLTLRGASFEPSPELLEAFRLLVEHETRIPYPPSCLLGAATRFAGAGSSQEVVGTASSVVEAHAAFRRSVVELVSGEAEWTAKAARPTTKSREVGHATSKRSPPQEHCRSIDLRKVGKAMHRRGTVANVADRVNRTRRNTIFQKVHSGPRSPPTAKTGEGGNSKERPDSEDDTDGETPATVSPSASFGPLLSPSPSFGGGPPLSARKNSRSPSSSPSFGAAAPGRGRRGTTIISTGRTTGPPPRVGVSTRASRYTTQKQTELQVPLCLHALFLLRQHDRFVLEHLQNEYFAATTLTHSLFALQPKLVHTIYLLKTLEANFVELVARGGRERGRRARGESSSTSRGGAGAFPPDLHGAVAAAGKPPRGGTCTTPATGDEQLETGTGWLTRIHRISFKPVSDKFHTGCTVHSPSVFNKERNSGKQSDSGPMLVGKRSVDVLLSLCVSSSGSTSGCRAETQRMIC